MLREMITKKALNILQPSTTGAVGQCCNGNALDPQVLSSAAGRNWELRRRCGTWRRPLFGGWEMMINSSQKDTMEVSIWSEPLGNEMPTVQLPSMRTRDPFHHEVVFLSWFGTDFIWLVVFSNHCNLYPPWSPASVPLWNESVVVYAFAFTSIIL